MGGDGQDRAGRAESERHLRRTTRKGERFAPLALPAYPAHAAVKRAARHRVSECEPQTELAHTLFRATEVPGVSRRLWRVRLRRPSRRHDAPCAEAARVDRVEEVEHFADRLDISAPAQ